MANVRQYIGARYVTKIYENSVNPASAEWEPATAYEPLTMVTYNNSSYLSKKDVPNTVGDPSNNPDYWIVTGAYNGQIAYLQDQIDDIKEGIVTPEMFGAAGDGVSDDTSAIQDAFNAGRIIVMNNTYKITDTLFISGKKKITGSGTIISYLPGVASDEYIIAFGASSLGVSGVPFEGIVEGLTFIPMTGNYNYGLSFTNAENVEVRNIVMDFSNANCHNKFIFFGTNATVAPNNSNNQNYLIDGCLFISDSDPTSLKNKCETVSFADNRKHITISNNIFMNPKDDFVGIHLCKDIEVINNFAHSFSGRILGTWVQNMIVADNVIEVEPDISCQGIQIDYEAGGNGSVNENIQIINNIVDYRGTTNTNTQYGIRLRGCKRSVITDNNLITANGNQGRLVLENMPVTAYTPSFIFCEDNIISNNIASDIFFVTAGKTVSDVMIPNLIEGNKIGRRLWTNSYYNISRNNIIETDTFDTNTLDAYSFDAEHTQPNLIFSRDVALTGAEEEMEIDGFTQYYVATRGKLNVYYRVLNDPNYTLPSGSYYVFKIYKNGINIGTFRAASNYFSYGSIAAADQLCNAGDILKVKCYIEGTIPSLIPHHTFLGMFFTPLNNC